MHAFVSLDVTVSVPGGDGDEIIAIPTHNPLGGLHCARAKKNSTTWVSACVDDVQTNRRHSSSID